MVTGKIITALTKIEAENHWSRGRLREAMQIYEILLEASPNMTLNTRVAIEARIDLLCKELERSTEQEDNQEVEAAIKKLRMAMAQDESVVGVRSEAKRYYKAGQYADTLENLKQLVRLNASDEICINILADCLVQLHDIKELPVAVDLFLAEVFQNADKAAQFKFLLAEKMAQKGHTQHAEVLHRHHDRFTSTHL